MSYYFDMRFRQVSSRAEMLDLCLSMANALTEKDNAQSFIKTLSKGFWTLGSDFETTLGERKVLKYYIRSSFQENFVYWKQYNLLALPGGAWPESIFDQEFTPIISFQDSTDQAYPLETWPEQISLFRTVKNNIQALPDDDVQHCLTQHVPGFEREDTSANMDYLRRWLVYTLIFEALDLKKWLNFSGGDFERFGVSGVTSSEQEFQLYHYAYMLAKANKGRC